MAKRKFSFLADENEKYEQEYYRELAEEKRMQEAEAKKQLANKGKHGVSMVSGNSTPIVGEKNTYHIAGWYEDTPQGERNPAIVTWELFKKRSNGRFTSTNIKKTGDGTFTFGEMSIRNTYRLEAYLYRPEGGGLIINPKPSATPRIGKVELHYVDDKKSDTFSFYDRLRAKAHTTGMPRKELVFILWEDDSKGGGHSAGNQPIEVKSARVQHNGLAVVEFTLTKGLMQKAMKGEADAKEFEFYVTVEYYKGKIHDSKNVNVHNPFYKAPEKKVSHPKAPGSPAEQKPPSKREEKNLLIHQADGYLLHDWAEVKGKAQKNKEVTVNRTHGRSTVRVKSQSIKKREGKCLCQQYDLVWGNKVSCEFRKKVVEICADLWGESRKIEMANGLMAVMNVETGGSFKAHQIMGSKLKDVNLLTKDDFWMNQKTHSGGSRAVGLIQFTQAALQAINEFTSGSGFDKLHEVKLRFAKMGEVKQLDYVKKYFEPHKNNIKSPEDIYLSVFAPKGVGKENDYHLYSKHINPKTNFEIEDNKNYQANKSVDLENKGKKYGADGVIQRVEILGRYRTKFAEGLSNKGKEFLCYTEEIPTKNKFKEKCPDDCSECFEYSDVVANPKINNQSDNVNKNRFKRDKRYNSKHPYPEGYYHTGTDILASLNTPLKSMLCGEVIEAYNTDGDLGIIVIVKSKDKDGNLIWIRYCHLSSTKVSKGDKIKHGTIIGLSGNTGNAKRILPQYYHVHIEASTDGIFYGGNSRVDPEQFMKTKFDSTKEGNVVKK